MSLSLLGAPQANRGATSIAAFTGAVMTLHIVATRGHVTWWIWAIRDGAGALVEESTIQFRSAAAAEAQGRARIARFEARPPQ